MNGVSMTGEDILWAIQRISSPASDFVMVFVSDSVTAGLLWFVMAAVMMCSPRYRAMGMAVVVSVCVTYLVTDAVLKPLFDTMRPFETMDVQPIVPAPDNASFPSGHTASSFAAATAMFLFDRRIGSVAGAYACLVGFSRMYLFMHWPADVVGGALVGILCTLFAVFSMYRLIPCFKGFCEDAGDQ